RRSAPLGALQARARFASRSPRRGRHARRTAWLWTCGTPTGCHGGRRMNKDAYRRALETCATEPIHVIGGIQPPGVLLVYQRGTKQVLAASANAVELFEAGGIGDILGQPVHALLDTVVLRLVSEAVASAEPGPSRLAGVGHISAAHPTPHRS